MIAPRCRHILIIHTKPHKRRHSPPTPPNQSRDIALEGTISTPALLIWSSNERCNWSTAQWPVPWFPWFCVEGKWAGVGERVWEECLGCVAPKLLEHIDHIAHKPTRSIEIVCHGVGVWYSLLIAAATSLVSSACSLLWPRQLGPTSWYVFFS